MNGYRPTLLIVGPGLDDGTRTKKLAAILARQFRVVRLHRRQYRLDLPPCSVAQEVDDVLAIARNAGEPVYIYGHSSGGVVALEALVASPSSFAGAVIFEPALPIEGPWSGPLKEMRAHLAAGRPGKAMAVFTRRAVGLPAWKSWLVGVFTALVPHYRRLVACQANDLEAMNQMHDRLGAYAQNTVPTVLLNGDRSPTWIIRAVDAVAAAMPQTRRVTLPGRDHGADLKAPEEVAEVIKSLVS
jgi:pimeloyl-ACP methyl ester carboxylesterase